MSFEHVVPAPRHAPWQFAWVVMVQTVATVAVEQHAPVGVGCGHGLAAQLVPAPRQVPWQLACVVMVQVTALLEEVPQHAPVGAGCGQVSLPHTVPAPRQPPPVAVHCA